MEKKTLDVIFKELSIDKDFKKELKEKVWETIQEYIDWALYQVVRDDEDQDISKQIKSIVREVLKENKNIMKWRILERIKEKYLS